MEKSSEVIFTTTNSFRSVGMGWGNRIGNVSISYCFTSQCLSVIKYIPDKETTCEIFNTRTLLGQLFADPVAKPLSLNITKRRGKYTETNSLTVFNPLAPEFSLKF